MYSYDSVFPGLRLKDVLPKVCPFQSPKRIDAVHEPQEHLNVRFALQNEILLGFHCQGGFLVIDHAVKAAALAISISLESLVHERATDHVVFKIPLDVFLAFNVDCFQ